MRLRDPVRLAPGTPASRVLALALLALLALLAAVPVLALYAELDETRARVAIQREQLDRIVAKRAELREAITRSTPDDGGDLLRGDTPALAGAALQARITALTTDVGARLQSTQVIEDGPGDDDAEDDGSEMRRRLTVQVRLDASAEALRDLLHAIEAGRPRLYLDAVTIRPTSPGSTILAVGFNAYGFLGAPR